MVTTDDARWLAGYLRRMVSSRPAVWASSEMTLAQLLALHLISAKAPITLIALSEALGTRPPATSAMVDRLARAGLVYRMPDPEDRRRVLLAATGHAVAMIGKIDLQTARRLQVVLNSMGAALSHRGHQGHRIPPRPLVPRPSWYRGGRWAALLGSWAVHAPQHPFPDRAVRVRSDASPDLVGVGSGDYLATR